MGIVLWIVSGLVAVIVARIVPLRVTVSRVVDGMVASAATLTAGAAATAADFGGWNEPDWRAASFVFLVTLAALGLVRVWRLLAAGR